MAVPLELKCSGVVAGGIYSRPLLEKMLKIAAKVTGWTLAKDERTIVPLEINPVPALYDEERDIVTFTAMDGARMVRCMVTRDALRALARRRAESAKEMLEAYRSCAPQIHRIAARKYERRQIDLDGSVMVLQRDIAVEQ